MRVVRVNDPEFFEMIKNELVVSDHVDREQYVAFLKQSFLAAPQAFCVVAAIDEYSIVGFMIALYASPNNHTFLPHVWAKPGLPLEVADEGLANILAWTAALGFKSIRGETKRNTEAMYRRWGFKEYSKIIELEIPCRAEKIGFLNLSHNELTSKQEVQNGRIESETDEHIESGAAGSQREAAAVVDGTTGEVGESKEPSLPGTDGGELSSGGPASKSVD